MESVILYGSQYGTTRRYAEALGRMSGLPVYNAQHKPDLAGCRLAVHLGGLYAGGVKGLKQTLQALPQDARLMIVTVGLADPRRPGQRRQHPPLHLPAGAPGGAGAQSDLPSAGRHRLQ